jgi:hypothetical protein
VNDTIKLAEALKYPFISIRDRDLSPVCRMGIYLPAEEKEGRKAGELHTGLR